MAGIREPFEIIDKATAPLNRMANAFSGAAAQAQGLDIAAAGSNAALDSLSASVNGISGKLTAGFSQVVTVLSDIGNKLQGITAALNAVPASASSGLTGASQAARVTAGSLQAVQYAATTSVGAFNAASNGAVTLGTQLRLAGESSQNMARLMTNGADGFRAAIESVINSANRLGAAVESNGKQSRNAIDRTTASANKLTNAIRGAIAALGGLAAVRGIVNLSDTLSQSQARINAITGDLARTQEVQEQIFQAAQRSRTPYVDMLQTVASLKAQTGDTFSSLEEATAFTELLNKQFKLSGANATAIQSTMYNLTQALSTGVLRGQDLNIVMANAPGIAQRIADTMGLSLGQLKEVAAQGKVTADIVKRAMLGSAQEINEAFEDLPMTFGDAMIKMKNAGVKALAPVTQMIANAIDSPEFDAAMRNITAGMIVIANVASAAFGAIADMAQFASDHLNVLVPIVLGAATAFAIYQGYATAAATAQAVLNMVQAASPAMILALKVALIVGALVALVAWLHISANTGHTVFGDIAGTAQGCLYAIVNGLLIVGNFFLSVAESAANAWNQMVYSIQSAVIGFAQGAIRAFASVVRGAENAANAIANAFISGANAAIGGINGLINAINQIPGINLSTVGTIGAASIDNSLSSAIDGIAASLDNLKPEAVETVSFGRFDTVSMGDAFNQGFEKGASWGDNVQNGITDAFSGVFGGLPGDMSEFLGGGDMGDILSGIENLADTMGGGAGSGGKGKVGSVDKVKKVENCKLSDEDLKIYRDLAERKYQNRIELQTLAPNIQVSIPESAAGNLSAQDVADTIAKLLIEQSAAHTAVAHV